MDKVERNPIMFPTKLLIVVTTLEKILGLELSVKITQVMFLL
jgi:hypothetical protein